MNKINPINVLILILSCLITGIVIQNYTVTPVYKKVTENITINVINNKVTMEDSIYLYLKDINVKFKTVVVAQAVIESGNFTSNIYKKNNNLFGMKKASTRPTVGKKSGTYAKYKNWQESCLDYAFYQAYFCNKIKTEEEYINHLCKNYAEDPEYKNKLERKIAELRNTSSFTKS